MDQLSDNRYQITKLAAVILLTVLCLLLSVNEASAAVLYSQAANQDVYEGQTFALDWFLDTEEKPINSVDLKINFSSEFLEATEVSTGNSLINLWIKYPVLDNEKGAIELTGGIANGVNHTQVPIFRSVFKAKKTGAASITLNTDSLILLNDGAGTPEQLKFRNELFNIYPASFQPIVVSSATHPDQNRWYGARTVEIKFLPKADTDYTYSFSSNIDLIPDDQNMEVPEKLVYENRPDGIYYFKLNQRVGPSTWQEASVYRVQIDASGPESFQPLIGSEPSVFEGLEFVSFSTVDKTSGISHYKVKVGLFGKANETQSPYKLHKPWVGDKIEVMAYDVAGNARTETIAWKGYVSEFEFKLILIFIGAASLVVNWIVRKQMNKNKA